MAWIGANLISGPNGPTVTHGMLEELVIGLYQGEGRDEHSSPSLVEGFADPANYNAPGGAARSTKSLQGILRLLC